MGETTEEITLGDIEMLLRILDDERLPPIMIRVKTDAVEVVKSHADDRGLRVRDTVGRWTRYGDMDTTAMMKALRLISNNAPQVFSDIWKLLNEAKGLNEEYMALILDRWGGEILADAIKSLGEHVFYST